MIKIKDSEKCAVGEVELPQLCVECKARHNGICGALKPDELRTLNGFSTKKTFQHGLTLVSEEEEYPFFGVVLDGVLKLSKVLPDGRQQIVGLQFSPDFMGRPFHPESHLSVECATDVTICTMPRKRFEELLQRSPELQQRLFKQTLNELDESRDWLLTLGRKNAKERVASFLLVLSEHLNKAAGLEGQEDAKDVFGFDLPLSRADMADFLGLTIETVSRQISALKKANIIDIQHNRHVEIKNRQKLAEMAQD